MPAAGGPERGPFIIASRIFAPEPAAASFRLERAAASLARIGPTRVLTTTFGAEPRRSSRAGADVRRFPVLRYASGYVRGYLQYLSFDIPLFFRLLAQPRGSVVLCEPPPTTGLVTRVACALRGFKYAYFAADLWSEALVTAGTPGIVRSVVQWMERRAIGGAATVLAVSPDVAERLPRFGAKNVVVVGNGINTEQFKPAEPGNADQGPLLVYAGTASEVHGAAIFIDAMRHIVQRHPGARMVFIGHGSEIEQMKQDAAGLPVEFLERQPADVVADWLNRADIALASVRPGHYGFAFPTKAYAAAACGTPVVYTGSGPTDRTIADNGLGRVAGYEAVAIADAVDAQLADDSWDAAAAREWVECNGSLSAVGDRVAEALLEVRK
jgi:glycosyltransferase involved in cell wall biosynthesis